MFNKEELHCSIKHSIKVYLYELLQLDSRKTFR